MLVEEKVDLIHNFIFPMIRMTRTRSNGASQNHYIKEKDKEGASQQDISR